MKCAMMIALTSTIAILAGCGASPAIPTEPSIPVTDTMRDACPFADDAFIEDIIIAADVDMMAGLTEQEAVDAAVEGCTTAAGGDQDLATECSDCFVGVITEVYGQ